MSGSLPSQNGMGTDLTFTEFVPELHDTAVYQTDDGTLFYYCNNDYRPQRLFVKWDGKEIDAELPKYSHVREELRVEAHSDALYFAVAGFTKSDKVYKAVFSPATGITVTEFRKWNEAYGRFTWQWYGTLIKGGTGRIIRLCDTQPTDVGAVLRTDPRWAAMRWSSAWCIHRGTTIYMEENGSQQAAHVLNDREIVLEIPAGPPDTYLVSCCQDSSRFLYFAREAVLLTFDTETLQFLPMLSCGPDMRIGTLVGIHKSKITVFNKRALWEAQLPDGYFADPVASAVLHIDSEARLSTTSTSPSTSKASRKRARPPVKPETKKEAATGTERRYPSRRKATEAAGKK